MWGKREGLNLLKKMLRFLIWVTGWFIEHRKKIGLAGVVSGGDGRDKKSTLSWQSCLWPHRVPRFLPMQFVWLLGQEGLSLSPGLTPGAPGQSCSSAHCPLPVAAQRKPIQQWGEGGVVPEGSEGSQQGAGRRLAVPGSQVQLGSILGDNIYNVPSPRIIPPACPPSTFPADGFSRLLNNWLGSGAPRLTDCCPSVPSLFSRMPKSPRWSDC